MIKPAPPSRANSQVLELEIDAMDVMEWQHGQRTPQASDANLAALVKQSAKSHESAPVAAEAARTLPLVARARVTEAPPPGPARVTEAPPPGPARTIEAPQPRASELIAPSREPGTRRILPGPPRGSTALGERAEQPAPTRRVSAPGVRAKASPGAAFPPIATPPPSAHSLQPVSLPMSVGGYPIYAPPAPAASRPPSLYPRSQSDGLNEGLNDFRNDDDQNDGDHDRHKTVNARPSHRRLERLSSPDPLAISDVRLPLPENRELGEGKRAPSNRWLWWIVGATGVIVATLAVIVLGSIAPIYTPASADSPPTSTEEAPSPETSDPSPAPSAAQMAPPTPSTAAASPTAALHPLPSPGAAPASALAGHSPAIPAVPAPTSPGYGAPSQPAGRGVYRLGGKKVIIDYQTRAGESVPSLVAQDSEDPAVARARSAYLIGNEKLFAGDAAGAVEAYHEALGLYPGYVGGYRGLGLAYAQLGQTKQALDALKTYVTAAPMANDIALIKKRIARLQGK